MSDIEGTAIPATLRLRSDRFDLMTTALGCRTDIARGELLGLSPRTIYRARRGSFGLEFIVKTIFVLQQHREALAEFNLCPSLDELFEVVTPALAKAA
nr:hypothetical protein [Micromonospora sp. DSM 115978]